MGAASVQLGPQTVALVVRMHTQLGVPLAKVADLLRTQFGVTVTPGGLAHVLHRAARQAAPTYTASCQQVRESPVVTPDETGWRVGAVRHWLWVFTPKTTVYAIRAGRGFDDAATILGADFAGVLVRDGWAPYRHFTDALRSMPMSGLCRYRCRHRCGKRRLHRGHRHNHHALTGQRLFSHSGRERRPSCQICRASPSPARLRGSQRVLRPSSRGKATHRARCERSCIWCLTSAVGCMPRSSTSAISRSERRSFCEPGGTPGTSGI